jgi:hypothetical protein
MKQTGACTKSDLQNAAAACSGGANTIGCGQFFQFEFSSNPACASCLQPFDYDLSQNTGVFQCAAAYVDGTCNRNAACMLDCTQQSCGGCFDPMSTAQCQSQVTAASGECATFSTQCVTQALGGSAAFCDPATYQGNFGAWLQGVGAQYCGP